MHSNKIQVTVFNRNSERITCCTLQGGAGESEFIDLFCLAAGSIY